MLLCANPNQDVVYIYMFNYIGQTEIASLMLGPEEDFKVRHCKCRGHDFETNFLNLFT